MRWFVGRRFNKISLVVSNLFNSAPRVGNEETPEVIKTAGESNIHFTNLILNSTHMMKPLDLSVRGPSKKHWTIGEKNKKYTFPKALFSMLLKRLMALAPNVKKNLQISYVFDLYP